MKKIVLAGGCFWGLQKYLDQFEGIEKTTVGYANGFTENPVYPDVKSQKTGHAEVVEVFYHEAVISLEEILDLYFKVIDPTSLNRQGEDEGTSYRTGIYYEDLKDLSIIQKVYDEVASMLEKPCVVEVEELKCFYPAEEYHQKYLEKNPDGYCHIGGCFFK